MDNNDIAASIAQLEEAVENIKEFTRRADATLEAIRKDVQDRSHALRNEFQSKFIVVENNVDIIRKDLTQVQLSLKERTCTAHGEDLKELKSSVKGLERVRDQFVGGVAITGVVGTILGVVGGWLISLLHK
jgi:molecular chaperone GrpE (heat shock protein)